MLKSPYSPVTGVVASAFMFTLALGEAGVEQGESLELYNVMKKEWFPLLWSMLVGPVLEAGQIFLM